jgi:dihydroorotate dehydrogenase electron transfer subunit
VTQCKKNKGDYTPLVRFNRQLGPSTYRLGLEFTGDVAQAMASFRPGQFIELDVSCAAVPDHRDIPIHLRDKALRHVLLRRPFSPCSVEATAGSVRMDIIYCVIGPATLRMTTLMPGTTVSMLGPLGNGFPCPKGKKTALLVAGGVGTPPIQHLATDLAANDEAPQTVFFVGTQTITDPPFEAHTTGKSITIPELEKHAIETHIATDDGSAGHRGFVTECLEKWLTNHPDQNRSKLVIYTCGPEPMLSKVSHIAEANAIDCYVSLERSMACGLGLCQSCAVEVRRTNSSETVYKMCCTHGPVFNANTVIFTNDR